MIGALVIASASPAHPSSRHVLDDFTDFRNNVWTETFLHRWSPPTNSWTSLSVSGTPWPDGSGIFEMLTKKGPGFRFVQNGSVPRGSGNGVQIADVDHLVDQQRYIGTVTDFVGKVMFPPSGNPNGFPAYGDWNVLWEFTQSDVVHNLFGVDALARGGPRLYVRTFDPARPDNRNGRKARARAPLQLGRWYDWRWQIKWSEGEDGFVNFWFDGRRIAAWKGPNLAPGSGAPYLELGWYGGEEPGRNEVRYAALQKL